MNKYDSTEDTMKHKNRVKEILEIFIDILSEQAGIKDNRLMGKIIDELRKRGENHDNSKLEDIEKETFNEYTPKLKNSTYGSDEYNEFLKGMSLALKHHYENNSHHPEHYENGINGFDLFDLIEMLCDWKGATERHEDGDIIKSIWNINKDRFNISHDICRMLSYTAREMFDDVDYDNDGVYDLEYTLFDMVNYVVDYAEEIYINRNDSLFDDILTNTLKITRTWK